ncbi:hypothetical protein [Brucella gallinifaecis]|uniref:hypothetical protein n=1 Tax=Brucella gallinifaecis TaxID=215590 RepID=UPI002362A784|nr:hypothetical protein [Brucella gallinifaecis]
MSFTFRATLLALVLATPTAGFTQNTQTFEAADGSYSFQYPDDFALNHMFADGTGDVTGVTASNMDNGDVLVTFLGPRDPGDITDVSEQSRQAIVDEFTKAIAVLPSIKFKSSAMTTMLGQPAVDMVFTNKRFGTVAINRYVFTVRDGKAYNFECIYREDKAEQFAPACDLAASTVSLLDTDADSSSEAEEHKAGDASIAGTCSELELNRRTGEVTELTSNMLMQDQSPAMIARVKTAHDAAMAIEARAGSKPSEQDCKDVDAIIETLK